MSGFLGLMAGFLGVVALIIGFWRDPSAPFSTALKWFCVIYLPFALWIFAAGGMQR